MMGGRTREALASANKAVELSERIGITDEALFARQVRGVALCELGEDEGLEALRDALERAQDAGGVQVVSVGYNNLGHFLWLLDSPRSGLEAKREGIAFSKRRGLLGSARWTQMETMWIHFDLGEWDDVLAIAGELNAVDREREELQLRAIVPTFETFVLALRGQSTVGIDTPDEFVSLARQIADPQVLVPALAVGAVVAHAQNDERAAIAAIEELEQVTRLGPDWSRLLEAAPAVRICVELGRPDLAERFLDRPDTRGARLAHANVACSAIVAEARSKTDEAAALYQDAARRWQEYEFPFERAHALLGHWRCTGNAESLGEAQRIFNRLGAVVPQATAEELPRAARRAK